MAESSPKPFTDADRWLAQAVVEALQMSLEAMTSERPEVTFQPEPDAVSPEPLAGWLWFEQPLTAGPGTVCWVAVSAETRDEIGKKALLAAGIDDATPDDCQSTWKEIQGQVLSGLAQAIGRRLRKEVTSDNGRELSAQPATVAFLTRLTVTFAGATPFRICFAWNDSLHNTLEPQQAPEPSSQPSSAQQKAAPSAPGAKKASAAVENSRTLDLLLEVELPVSVSFGRAQLPLKDVLKLNSGSIVELNRSIAEPVDIIVNNCVIARGEVVVVEGNYGVRIKQIISKEERLRTLH